MLADWYFCCCVKADSDRMAVYLPILEALSADDSDAELTQVALDELQRTDIWMRTYAAPIVANLARRRTVSSGLRGRIARFLVELAGNIPEKARPPFEKLCETLSSITGGGLNDQIRACADALAQVPGRTATDTPYLDIHDFLPETLALLATERLPIDEAKHMLTDSEFTPVFEKALAHGVGRQAFCLALQLAMNASDHYSRERLARIIRTNSYCDAELEPDLLQSLAGILFHPGLAGSADQWAARAIDESLKLEGLRGFRQLARPKRRYSDVAKPLAIQAAGLLETCATMFWQLAVWETASRLSPATAAPKLASLWCQPTAPKGVIEMSGPYPKETCSEWHRQLSGLAKLRAGLDVRLRVRSSREFQVSADIAAVISPWLVPDRQGTAIRSYPDIQNEAVQLRLFATTLMAARFIRDPTIDDDVRQSHIRLLGHTTDVLRPYRKWLLSRETPKKSPHLRFSPDVTGLATFVRGQVLLVASCEFDAIRPALIVGILDQQGYFSTSIFPRVVMSWIEDTYQSTAKSLEPQWAAYVKEVYARAYPDEATRRASGDELKQLIDSAVVVRFLAPGGSESPVAADSQLNWKRLKQWPNLGRQLFLTPGLAADEWQEQPGWDRTKNYQTKLFRAIERAASLKNPGTLSAADREMWRTEWVALIGEINSRMLMDRFLRMRLAELIDDSVLESDREQQGLIAALIIEFGSEWDWRSVLYRLYPLDAAAWRTEVLEARHDVRADVLTLLFHELERTESLPRLLQAATPRSRRSELHKERLIRDTLCRVAQMNAMQPDRHAKALMKKLSGLYEELRERRMVRLRRIDTSIEIAGAARALIPEDAHASAPEWSLRLASCDPNRSQIALLADEVDTRDCLNFFEADRLTIRNFLDKKEGGEVLAGVVARREATGGFNCTFNCGLPFYVPGFMPADHPPDGLFVRASLRWIASKQQWRVVAAHGLSRFEEPGCCVLDTLRPGRMPALDSGRRIDPDLWCPDISRSFDRENQAPVPVHAVLSRSSSGLWEPLARELPEAIIRHGGGPVVVVFAGEATEPLGETTWRVCVGPGEHYLLQRGQFVPEDRVQLDEQFTRRNRGLLVTLSASNSVGRVLLRLHSEPFEPSRYPNLMTPFDRRNLVWKNLFDADEPVHAIRRAGGWIAVPPEKLEGKWPQIDVSWDPRPPFDVNEAEIQMTGWDWRKATIRGKYILFHEIELDNEQDRSNFVADWLSLKKRSLILLRDCDGNVRGDGYVWCRTPERISVMVDAESITMAELKDGRVPEFRQDRPAEVTVINWKPSDTFVGQTPPTGFIEGRSYEGLLAGVTDSRQRGRAFCKIWWLVDGVIHEETIEAPGSNYRIGAKVQAVFSNSQWQYRVFEYYIRARALWEEVERGPGEAAYWLGAVSSYRGKRGLVEVAPGSFALLPLRGGAPHMARLAAGESSGGLERDWRWQAAARSGTSPHTVLTCADEEGLMVSGFCPRQPQGRQVLIREIAMSIEAIGRLFALRRVVALQEVYSEEPVSAGGTEKIKEALAEYFSNPHDLTGEYDASRRTVILNIDPKQRLRIAVPLIPEEAVYYGGMRYAIDSRDRYADCRLRLRGTPNECMASFRDVAPITLEDYNTNVFGAGLSGDDLREPLYYVPEEVGTGDAQIRHIFEWGFGKAVEARSEQLRYRGGNFEQATPILFYGDAIKNVRFWEMPTADGQMLIMSVENVEISHATSLYRQRTDHGIIHMLEVSVIGDDVTVGSVIGFSDAESGTQTYSRVAAELTEEGLATLQARVREGGFLDGKNILGRLRTRDFEASLGKRLIFEHVRLSFQWAEQTGPLMSGEVVFMRGREIRSRTNDYDLVLRPWGEPFEEDLGSDLRNCRVSRRRFSVRQDLLPRILHEGEPEIEDFTFLVHLSRDEVRGITASLIHRRIPARSLGVLRRLSQGEPFLACVQSRGDRGLRVEAGPGVFFDIPFDAIEGPPPQMADGAILQIEFSADADKFRVTAVTSGDQRYVPEGARPAVALPFNTLFDESRVDFDGAERNAYWESKLFTIGGLPSIVASGGFWNEQAKRWEGPRAAGFLQLMRTPHPKIVLLGRAEQKPDQQEIAAYLAPCPPEWPWGNLEVDAASGTVNAVVAGNKYQLDWTAVSFADCSVADMQERLSLAWHYHDTETVHWTPERRTVRTRLLDEHTALTGPVFFDHYRNGLTLRYRGMDFASFGYPVEELIRTVALRRNASFTVAGFSNTGGLWIELAPGRVAELPAALLVAAHANCSLAALRWRDFAPGDQVRLRKKQGGSLAVDRLVLMEWLPGPRNAFGPRAFLPTGAHDPATGALMLGQGAFQLTVPTREFDPSCKAMIISRGAPPVAAEDRLPAAGDTVLLGVLQNGYVVPLGREDLRPVPDFHDQGLWNGYPLADEIRDGKLKSCIAAAGGALPMTVESVNRGVLAFSPRHQNRTAGSDSIQAGNETIQQGRVLGILDSRWVVLKAGGRIIRANIQHVISGLPARFTVDAAAYLRDSATTIWFREDASGTLRFGLKTDESREIAASAVQILEAEGDAGLICRSAESQTFYWLSRQRAAWTDLSAAELRTVYSGHHAQFVAAIQYRDGWPNGASAITPAKAVRELRDLEVGKTFVARVVGQRAPAAGTLGDHYLVRSTTSNVVLACSSSGAELTQNQEITVEVIQRNMGRGPTPPSLLVAPPGSQRPRLDLPLSLLGLRIDLKRRPEFEQYLEFRRSGWEPPASPSVSGSASSEELKRLLCWAVDNYAEEAESIDARHALVAIGAAYEWAEKILQASEIELHYALIAVLLLRWYGARSPEDLRIVNPRLTPKEATHLVSEYSRLSLELFRNIGRRALRSAHIELLSTKWLFSSWTDTRKTGLWVRLTKVKEALMAELDADGLSAIMQFCKVCRLRPQAELTPIAEALLASLGDIDVHTCLLDSAHITSELIRLSQATPVSAYPDRLSRAHGTVLRELLDRITAGALDIVFLDPLPIFVRKSAQAQGASPARAAAGSGH